MRRLPENRLQLSRIGRVINPPPEFSLSVIAEETLSLVQGGIDSRYLET